MYRKKLMRCVTRLTAENESIPLCLCVCGCVCVYVCMCICYTIIETTRMKKNFESTIDSSVTTLPYDNESIPTTLIIVTVVETPKSKLFL
mmetsp:Transcript_43721/g.49003  ORF Transcript_43721/g.49003 Transcript_43721/m.49003 type:complete len:90 (+) Transcript_43721:34-303(+)